MKDNCLFRKNDVLIQYASQSIPCALIRTKKYALFWHTKGIVNIYSDYAMNKKIISFRLPYNIKMFYKLIDNEIWSSEEFINTKVDSLLKLKAFI